MDDEALRELINTTAAETRRHFEVVAQRLEDQLHTLAEAVSIGDEKLERRIASLEERVERGFQETQSMIKFSHAELDRRVSALEQAFTDLQARVERLESSTH